MSDMLCCVPGELETKCRFLAQTCAALRCACCQSGQRSIQPVSLSQDTLEVFVETPEAAAPTRKLRKGLSKVFGRKDSDSEGEAESVDAASGVGETEEALDGHLFSVGVAFAQVSSAVI